jgi:acyl dehydratase
LAVGRAGPAFEVGPLTRTHFVRYAGAAADFNPLHHDDEYARAAGYPSVLAHGMFSAGILASYLVGWLGPGCIVNFSVRFRAPVWPGDTLRAEATVMSVDSQSRTATLTLALRRTQAADEVVTSSAFVRLCVAA